MRIYLQRIVLFSGTVTSILIKRDLVLANAIETAIAKGLPIDSLSSAKRDYLVCC
jgi:hypothetical protein